MKKLWRPTRTLIASATSTTLLTNVRKLRVFSSMAEAATSSRSSDNYPHGIRSISGSTIADTIKRLGQRFEVVPLSEASAFVKPESVLYELDGQPRRWDIVQSHASVGVVLYHTDMDAFLIVRQFRPAVYATKQREASAAGGAPPPLSAGFTCELCAGLVDKPSLSLAEICCEEVKEEVGYVLPSADALRRVTSAVSASGTSGTAHTIFYTSVDEGMRAGDGGGLSGAGEAIEVLALPYDRALQFVLDSGVPKSPGLMFGILWAHGALRDGALPGRPGGAGREEARSEAGAAARSGLMTEGIVLRPVLPS